jgi:hypothetical protein
MSFNFSSSAKDCNQVYSEAVSAPVYPLIMDVIRYASMHFK